MDMTSVAERAQINLGLKFYQEPNLAELVGPASITAPNERQYVLRCPILIPGTNLVIPDEMQWCSPFIEKSLHHQSRVLKVAQNFMYLTIRHGLVESETDDLLHVDGFSMKIPHIPEQNYIWSDHTPTIVEAFGLKIPSDFDPLTHNLQYFIQDSRPDHPIQQTLLPAHIYALDPYIFHRRPTIPPGIPRTFVRLSLTPIPIDDCNNHINPAFGDLTPAHDGILEFRDKLARYPVAT